MAIPELGQFITADLDDIDLSQEHVIVRLASDGSRRILDANTIRTSPSLPTWEDIRDVRLGFWPDSPIVFWGPLNDVISLNSALIRAGRDGWYLPYPPADGIAVYPVEEPVNQVPILQQYQRNAAVSAHDLQVTLGTDVMQSATDDDYQTVKHSFIHLIGAAWQRYVEWATVDSEELIVGGNYDGTLLWRRYLDDHAATDAALCGTCDIANFARRFYFHANLPLFRRLRRSGIIYSVDRTANPWEASIFAVASQPESQYYDDLDTAYHLALRYYDERIGARLHQT